MPGRKRKISYLKRSVFWPCGSCRRNCVSSCIFCDTCKSWFHSECEQLTTDDFRVLSGSRIPFTCLSCLKEEIGDTYSYDAALIRLNLAAKEGFETAVCTAKRECVFLPTLSKAISVDTDKPITVDNDSLVLLRKYLPEHEGLPLSTSADGNCLFHALSIALYGNEKMSTELRVRTSLMMFMNKQRYMQHPKKKDLWFVSPDYEEASIDCTFSGVCSSSWTIIAAADATGTSIKSCYPCVNGTRDKTYQILNNLVFHPESESSHIEIRLMWTRIGPKTTHWTPNHFVPLQERICYSERREQVTLNENQERAASELREHATLYENQERANLTESRKWTSFSESREQATFSECQNETDTSVCSVNNVSSDPISFADVTTSTTVNDTLNIDSQTCLNPLPTSGFSAEDIYHKVTEKRNVLPDIPRGKKNNIYMLVDNKRNLERKKVDKKNQFHDDLGVWDTAKSTTVKTHYVMEGEKLKSVFLKREQYCIQKVQQGKRIFVPLEPQPDEATIVVLHKYYTTLKRQQDFKRRVSWYTCTFDISLGEVALVEYTGILQSSISSHGNARNPEEQYCRTDPKVMEEAAENLKAKNPREVYLDLAQNDSLNAPRNFQQMRDLKYRQQKKRAFVHKNNIADEMLDVMGMLNENPFVQKIEHVKNHVPTIILYHENQIQDMKHFLTHSSNPRVGIDRTFNLGSFYVTTMVYKNRRVVKRETLDHPIFLGPVMLHREATYPVYHSFFSHIRAKLAMGIKELDIRLPEKMEFGSDAEKALTKAIDDCFPNSTRKLCTKHLKDNVADYLKNKVGITSKDRKTVVEKIFGERGVVHANDTYSFEERCDDVKVAALNHPVFVQYFDKHLKHKLFHHVYEGDKENNAQDLWTNNNCESINNIFKLETNWKPQDTPSLIEKITNVIKLHFLDLKRALYGEGNYRLISAYRRFQVPIEKFKSNSKDDREKIFQKFLKADLKGSSTENHTITSKDGRYKIDSKACSVARKPGQRKRPCSEKALKRAHIHH